MFIIAILLNIYKNKNILNIILIIFIVKINLLFLEFLIN